MKKFATVMGVLATTACTWVEPTAQGQAVTLVKPAHVTHCQALGTVTASTKDSVGFIDRGEEKVATELLDLARNKAASMGADTIVAEGPPQDGSQTFRIYRCGQ